MNDLSNNEKKLIKELRGIKFGSLTVHVKNGVPWRVEEKIHSIALGDLSTDDIIP